MISTPFAMFVKRKLLLDSVYVSSGGGIILLNYIIHALEAFPLDIYYLMDKRNTTDYSFLDPGKIKYIRPSSIDRHKYYRTNKSKYDIVFTFNNLPPTIKMKNASVFTYFHQYLFIDNSDKGYNLKERLQLTIKRYFLSFFINNVNYFIVQTINIKDKFGSVFKVNPDKILVLPFYDDHYMSQPIHKPESNNQFVYISDGHPHKNHTRLLNAWELVNEKYPAARLTLTVSTHRYPPVSNAIERMKAKGVNVRNVGFQDIAGVIKLYNENKFLVYPSLAESFGLGLIEAVNNGCEIIASDLDYVKSVVRPTLVFDPLDPVSISKKVIEVIEHPNALTKTQLLISNKIDELLWTITTCSITTK